MIFLSIDGELQSAHVEGVGRIGRRVSESNEDFRQRIYATEVAGCLLEGLTDVEMKRAFQLGNQQHAASPSKTVTIGGEYHGAF